MKIEFDVVWVDDNKDFVQSLQIPLEQWMDDQGLVLKVFWHASEDGVFADLESRSVELIVLDYRLAGSKNGDTIVRDIRARGFLEDIVFYSQGDSPNSIFAMPPDGVFFVGRLDAKERIKDLMKSKIRHANDLATLRGWIVADAIELETILGRVLAKCFKEMETLFADRVLAEEGMFDFGKKYKVLSGIIKDRIADMRDKGAPADSITSLETCKKILDVFPQEIIDIRNALAHQRADGVGTGVKKIRTKTKGAKEISITPTNCIKIRKDVKKHLENLEALDGLV